MTEEQFETLKRVEEKLDQLLTRQQPRTCFAPDCNAIGIHEHAKDCWYCDYHHNMEGQLRSLGESLNGMTDKQVGSDAWNRKMARCSEMERELGV